MRYGRCISREKGEVLLGAYEESSSIYYLERGVLDASFLVNGGSKRLVGYIVPGVVFTKVGAFMDADTADCQVEYLAAEDSEIYSVSKNVFWEEIDRDTEFAQDYLENVIKINLYLIERVVYQGEHGVLNKCLRWLLFTAKFYGVETERGIEIPLPLTRELIASCLYVTRESTSVALKELVQEGLISLRNRKLIIYSLEGIRERLEATV